MKRDKERIDDMEQVMDTILSEETARFYDVLTLGGASQVVASPFFFCFFHKEMLDRGYKKIIYTETGNGPPELYDDPLSINDWKGQDLPKMYSIALSCGANIIALGPLARNPKAKFKVAKEMNLIYKHSGLIQMDFSRRDAFYTYQRMARELADLKSIETFSFGPRVWAFKFNKKNGPLWVLWSDEKERVSFRIQKDKAKVIKIEL